MFKEILKHIDFDKNESLLFVNQRDSKNISETQRKILYLAQDDYLADAVFFQIKENIEYKAQYIPQIFIYDNTDNNKFNSVALSEIHKRLWSSEIVPLYFVLENSEIKIYNTKQKISINDNNEGKEEINPADILELSEKTNAEILRKKNDYSAFLFQNGSFWETELYIKKYLKDAITKESPFEILIKNLHGLKEDLINSGILKEIANKIVIFTILIKYLEEKRDDNNNNVFTVKGNIFKEKWHVNNFSELIEDGGFIKLLDYLSEKFNGKIFELTPAEREQIENLSQKARNHISNFVNANYKTNNNQGYLWRLYSFRYLPVELISRIYEEFIPDTDGVVYTPPFLVDLLIDECMPLEDYNKFSSNKFKVIDPACGSGIFCVSAYQRLIDWHIINEYYKTQKWNKDLRIDTLKEILVENIFGIDKEPEAVNIAVFSLILALLEKLTPIQLWEDLDFGDKRNNTNKKFNNLKENNILPVNFFKYLQTANNDFDLVIGNPPFNPDGMNNSEYFEYLESEYQLKTSYKIPENNLALVFLDTSINLLNKNGLQCLVLPSGNILYNARATQYRTHFLENYYVPQIIDFTHLRETLFKSGKNKNKGRIATCAFFAKKQRPEKDSKILHLVSHRTTNEENKMFFVFDTYDFHLIPLNVALTQKHIWKSNLIGGGRLNWIADRLSKEKFTLDLYIKSSRDIEYLTGIYKLSSPKIYANDVLVIKRLLNNGIIQVDVLDYEKVNIKEKICFKYDIGIQFKNKNSFNEFYNTVITYKKMYSFFIALKSVEYLSERETSYNKIDFKTLPYPQSDTDIRALQLSQAEQVWQDDVLNYYIHQAKVSKNNPLNEVAGVDMLKDYADTFTWLMNLNYCPVKEKSFRTGKITRTKSYIAIEFQYCKDNIESTFEETTEEEYQNYFETQIGRNKIITRIVEYIDFANNKIYFIKPHQKRYWLKSIADRDAMKCFAEFGNNIFNEER